MTADADPAGARRALRRRLEQARIEAGVRHDQVAEALHWELPDLLLVAAVATGISDGRLQALIDFFHLDTVVDLEEPPGSPLSTGARVLAEYEPLGTAISTFEPFVVPGLLQTRAYAESVLRFYAPPEGVGALVEARLARQALFERDDAPEMTFLIDESALHRWTGAPVEGRALMREQVERVRQTARRPRVRIQVIPYAAGVHEGVKGPFVIVDSAAPLLYLEDAKGDVVSVDSERIGQHRERFGKLAAAATAPEELDVFLDRAGEDLA